MMVALIPVACQTDLQGSGTPTTHNPHTPVSPATSVIVDFDINSVLI